MIYGRRVCLGELPAALVQIQEVLIHAHYFSKKDIEICAAFDIAEGFDPHTKFPGIESLHQTLRATYTEPEPAAAT